MQLVNRNGKMKEGSFIHFPFIAVATADMQSNSISIALDDEY